MCVLSPLPCPTVMLSPTHATRMIISAGDRVVGGCTDKKVGAEGCGSAGGCIGSGAGITGTFALGSSRVSGGGTCGAIG